MYFVFLVPIIRKLNRLRRVVARWKGLIFLSHFPPGLLESIDKYQRYSRKSVFFWRFLALLDTKSTVSVTVVDLSYFAANWIAFLNDKSPVVSSEIRSKLFPHPSRFVTKLSNTTKSSLSPKSQFFFQTFYANDPSHNWFGIFSGCCIKCLPLKKGNGVLFIIFFQYCTQLSICLWRFQRRRTHVVCNFVRLCTNATQKCRRFLQFLCQQNIIHAKKFSIRSWYTFQWSLSGLNGSIRINS